MVHNTPASTATSTSAPSHKSEGFREPSKRILTPEQLIVFQQSSTHTDILAFITRLNGSIKGAKLTDKLEGETHPTITALERILDEVKQIAEETPPIENSGSRFGNPAFRTFYDRTSEAAESLHRTHLVPLGLPPDAIEEIASYFKECWGNRTRIDYGSGMELNWLCWILCLEKLGLFSESPSSDKSSSTTPTESIDKALILRVFWSYIQTMRLLQSKYWLEPAGSHGVWGLDDYHFLPFLWGSGQLVDHKFIRPRAIHDAEVVEEYAKDYMYFACIAFINSIKTASLRWHSPMLDDISAVKTWSKVNEGMMKMFKAEVLGKLPVVQHFLFGSLLPYSEESVTALNAAPLPSPLAASHDSATNGDSASSTTVSSNGGGEHPDGCGHGHSHSHVPRNIHPKVLESLKARGELGSLSPEGDMGGAGQREVGWGDCCGIPVPSVFGAAAEQAGSGGQAGAGYVLSGVRPVPFD